LRLFKIAESPGAVESFVELPAVLTHVSISKQEHKKAGLESGLIRWSVKTEHVQDLVEDLERGLGC
jgi:cystathionine beta-lyase/cystathionine gamma-synthase